MKQLAMRLAPQILVGLAMGLASTVPAWAVYKVVGPDGSVTFTDIPPSGGQASRLPGVSATPPQATGRLPAHLRQLQRQAPVLIYTSPDCKACDDGISFLRHRGIPYAARTILSPRDVRAFRAIEPGMRLPLLRVAGVDLAPGFSAAAWSQALNAAGYPRRSELPPGYRFAIPRPLAPNPAAPLRGQTPAAAATQPPVQAPPDPNAPPGFKF